MSRRRRGGMHGSVFRDRDWACTRHTKRPTEFGRSDQNAPGAHRPSQCAAQCLGGGRSRRCPEGRPRRRSCAGEGQGKPEGRRAGAAQWRAHHHQGSIRRQRASPPRRATDHSSTMSRARMRRWWAGCAPPAPSSWARPMCPNCAPTFRPTARCSARPRTPGITRRTAGGSTGGGAVAVAARLSPLEIGSDIGGSVRNPAHYNGILALKPTEWRVPGRGHVPDLPGRTRTTRYMGVFGPLARSVEDLEAALRIIAGPDGHDAEVPPVPLGPTPALKTARPPHRGARKQSAGEGVGRHGGRGAGDRAAAHESRCQGEAGRARGARLAAGLGRLVRSLPLSEPRPAAAQRARAHLRRERVVRSVGAFDSADGTARPRGILRRPRSPRPHHAPVRDLPRRLRCLADAGDARRRLRPPEVRPSRSGSTASSIRISSPARPTTSSPT